MLLHFRCPFMRIPRLSGRRDVRRTDHPLSGCCSDTTAPTHASCRHQARESPCDVDQGSCGWCFRQRLPSTAGERGCYGVLRRRALASRSQPSSCRPRPRRSRRPSTAWFAIVATAGLAMHHFGGCVRQSASDLPAEGSRLAEIRPQGSGRRPRFLRCPVTFVCGAHPRSPLLLGLSAVCWVKPRIAEGSATPRYVHGDPLLVL